MNSFAVFFFCCFLSLFLVAQAESNDGVYIVYTGAASSSPSGFHSDHIMSSSSMESWNDRVIHKYSNAFSGCAMRLSKEEAKSIAERPEVVSVFPEPLLQLHTTHSWDFLKSLSDNVGFKPRQISASNSSLSGEDVIIGILDTGIWPEAKSFNDHGLGPIPKRWKGKCVEGPDFKSSNCNRKLIGARNYVTDDNSTSARDYNGHGTHVAAIAAGRPVPGASYHGLARGTVQGGAPGSRIAVYRICDGSFCGGVVVLKAFDDAIADGVDVISLSYGSFAYGDFTTDPISIGAFHAVEKGILVVGSAGNGGAQEEPPRIQNVAPWILTVGATTTDRFFESDIVLGTNKTIKGGGVHYANFQKTPVYGLIDGRSAKLPDANDAEASNCFPEALDPKKVKGKIVLCEDSLGDNTPGGKHESVLSLGGIGTLCIDNYAQLIDSVYGSAPLILISWQDAERIQAYINSTRKPVATILPTVAVEKYKPAPSVAFFSGRGSIYDDDLSVIKPDIVAPGVDILSAWPSNVTNQAFNILSGSSQACPHVSGIAALVKSQYPSCSPSAIRSAIMTTARQTNNLNAPITDNLGDPATVFDLGAGEVTMFGPLQPGLVYETKVADYLLFLCNKGYNESRIKLIASKLPANFSCPNNSNEALVPNLNYPSMFTMQPEGRHHLTVKRTVTNVGDAESVYKVKVEVDADGPLRIRVSPTELKFTKRIKQLSYKVTFRYPNNTQLTVGRASGSITWSNEKYRVRIPLYAVYYY